MRVSLGAVRFRALRGGLGPDLYLEQGDSILGPRRARFAFLHAVALVHRGRSLAALERANAMGFPFGLRPGWFLRCRTR